MMIMILINPHFLNLAHQQCLACAKSCLTDRRVLTLWCWALTITIKFPGPILVKSFQTISEKCYHSFPHGNHLFTIFLHTCTLLKVCIMENTVLSRVCSFILTQFPASIQMPRKLKRMVYIYHQHAGQNHNIKTASKSF